MRFSILTLLGLVAVAAVGCAALQNANQVWAEVIYSITFITLLIALIAALMLRGGTRAFCIGFAVFGIAYFSDGLFDKSALVSTTLGDYLSTEIKGLRPEEPVIYHEPFVLNGGLRRDSAESLERSRQIWDSLGSRRGQSANAHFVIVFNSFFSLAFALGGGFIGRYFYWLRQKQEAGLAEQSR